MGSTAPNVSFTSRINKLCSVQSPLNGLPKALCTCLTSIFCPVVSCYSQLSRHMNRCFNFIQHQSPFYIFLIDCLILFYFVLLLFIANNQHNRGYIKSTSKLWASQVHILGKLCPQICGQILSTRKHTIFLKSLSRIIFFFDITCCSNEYPMR